MVSSDETDRAEVRVQQSGMARWWPLLVFAILIAVVVVVGVVFGLVGRPTCTSSRHSHAPDLKLVGKPVILCETLEAGPEKLACAEPTFGPDLVVSSRDLADSVRVEWVQFTDPEDCAIQEQMIEKCGWRRLLRFTTTLINQGDEAIVFGDPAASDLYHFSPCHGHYHMDDFTAYELVRGGTVVAAGRKQGFCLRDNERVHRRLRGKDTCAKGKFDCAYQGISAGWADVYGAHLDGQWIDITDLQDDGVYILRVAVNRNRSIPESQFTNNTAEVEIELRWSR